MLLGTHGPNRLARDETPYPLTRSCFIIFYGSLLFLAERPFIAFSGILGRSISRSYSKDFIFFQLAFTFWAFSPFFPLGKVQFSNDRSTQCSNKCNGIGERETR
jgi:hypothetical protein